MSSTAIRGCSISAPPYVCGCTYFKCVRTHCQRHAKMALMSSPPNPSDDDVRAWSGLLRLHAQLVPAIDRDLERATGMPLRWYDVLLELNSAPGRSLRMLELVDAVV